MERDVDRAFSTYTEIIDVIGPYIKGDEEGQEVVDHSNNERLYLFQ